MPIPRTVPPISIRIAETDQALVIKAAKKQGLSRHKFMQAAVLAAANSALAA
jgi:uncharacterized protein (DUF1778 family)